MFFWVLYNLFICHLFMSNTASSPSCFFLLLLLPSTCFNCRAVSREGAIAAQLWVMFSWAFLISTVLADMVPDGKLRFFFFSPNHIQQQQELFISGFILTLVKLGQCSSWSLKVSYNRGATLWWSYLIKIQRQSSFDYVFDALYKLVT